MKKVLSVLLLIVMFIPVMVFADATGPDPRPYEGVVVAEGGMKYYDYNSNNFDNPIGTIPKGEKVDIDYEFFLDDEICIMFSYKNSGGFAKAKDVINTELVGTDDKYVNALYDTVNVKALKDVTIRKGPGTAYEEVGTFKAGKIAEASYYVEEPLFIYIEYMDIKGWIDANDQNLSYGISIITTVDNETSCGVVPANTIFKDIWHDSLWGGAYNNKLDYNGCKVAEDTLSSTIMAHTKKIYKLNEDAKFYKVLGEEPTKELKTGTEFIALSIFDWISYIDTDVEFVYADVDGEQGWIRVKNEEAGATYVKDYVDPEESKKEDSKEKKTDSKTIVLACVIAAIAVAAAALILIIIVNKKKKTKEVPLETPKETPEA